MQIRQNLPCTTQYSHSSAKTEECKIITPRVVIWELSYFNGIIWIAMHGWSVAVSSQSPLAKRPLRTCIFSLFLVALWETSLLWLPHSEVWVGVSKEEIPSLSRKVQSQNADKKTEGGGVKVLHFIHNSKSYNEQIDGEWSDEELTIGYAGTM